MPDIPADLGGLTPLLLTDDDIEALVGEHRCIDPFDRDLLSGCSYDLRVGAVIRSRNRGRTFNCEKDEFHLESGECITFETLETINFGSPVLFGFIVNKHSVLAKGLFHPITKIDPGFGGKLAITLFNLGNVSEPIRYKQPLVSLILVPLRSSPKRLYGASQKASYREGSLEIASVVNEPSVAVDDAALSRMYGRPVARLYELVGELRKSVDAGLTKQTRAKRAQWIDIAWRFGVGLFGAVVALAGRYLIDYWTSAHH